jgi:hypothetical protein
MRCVLKRPFYLLVALEHFLMNERQRASALKRGCGTGPSCSDEGVANEHSKLHSAESLTTNKFTRSRWAIVLLDQVLARLEEECEPSSGCWDELLTATVAPNGGTYTEDSYDTNGNFLLEDDGTPPTTRLSPNE